MSEPGIRVDPGNADQLRAWDTAAGVFWVEEAELFEHSLHRHDDWLFRAAGIRDGGQAGWFQGRLDRC